MNTKILVWLLNIVLGYLSQMTPQLREAIGAFLKDQYCKALQTETEVDEKLLKVALWIFGYETPDCNK